MNKGKYIVIEGPQGVGKSTQVQILANRLMAAGIDVRIFREPDSQSSLTARAIRRIAQNPNYPLNSHTEVLLYNAARSEALEVIKTSVNQGIVCLVDSNYLSTLVYHYYTSQSPDDYETLSRIIKFAIDGMEPDLTIVLDAPVTELIERTKERYKEEQFNNLPPEYLEKARAGYLWEANNRSLPVVYANRPKDEVAEDIWQHVTNTLKSRHKRPDKTIDLSAAPPIDQHLVASDINITSKIKTNKNNLKDVVTSTENDVYAFTDHLSPLTVAAAMARLSRRGDDMRIILQDEFLGEEGKDEKLLQRVITAYGDDSVQQLVGQHVVVENASNLLSKKLEWGRLAAYLEQSTRYIYFDVKQPNGKYRFFTPHEFNSKVAAHYDQAMTAVFDLYSSMVRELTTYISQKSAVPEKERDAAWKSAVRAQACDAVRAVLPVATQTTVGIYASAQALEALIMRLLSDNLPEARRVGQQILDECRKVIPVFLERADRPDRGGANIAYMANTKSAVKKIASKELSNLHSEDIQDVKLNDYWPRNEIDIVADILYEHSALSLEEIRAEVAEWNYDKKFAVFKAAIGERLNRRHKPGRAFEKIHYSWDIICDYGSFRDLQRHRMVDDLNWQVLTPRYGYEVPKLIEEAGLSDKFEQCFDISLALYSYLQSAGHKLEAQYATLLGHKMRWKVTYNAREAFHLHELRTSPQGHPNYRKLVKQMHDQVAKVHPLIADAMIFVNKGEDEELTRLAAERYTQYKLKKLS